MPWAGWFRGGAQALEVEMFGTCVVTSLLSGGTEHIGQDVP